MTLDELKKAVDEGTVDTVLLAIADMEGRLQGKRLTATHFLDDVLDGVEPDEQALVMDALARIRANIARGAAAARAS